MEVPVISGNASEGIEVDRSLSWKENIWKKKAGFRCLANRHCETKDRHRTIRRAVRFWATEWGDKLAFAGEIDSLAEE